VLPLYKNKKEFDKVMNTRTIKEWDSHAFPVAASCTKSINHGLSSTVRARLELDHFSLPVPYII